MFLFVQIIRYTYHIQRSPNVAPVNEIDENFHLMNVWKRINTLEIGINMSM